jgi:hypothetical protein
MICRDCGGTMEGDGLTSVVHCESVDVTDQSSFPQAPFEADAGPIYCGRWDRRLRPGGAGVGKRKSAPEKNDLAGWDRIINPPKAMRCTGCGGPMVEGPGWYADDTNLRCKSFQGVIMEGDGPIYCSDKPQRVLDHAWAVGRWRHWWWS